MTLIVTPNIADPDGFYEELIDAQREYLEIQRTRIEASATAQRLAADIERLTNAPLAP